MNPAYLDSVRLLLAVAPEVLAGGGFALKGGTAINLFHRNLPRLSVDLDLVFVNHQPRREEALDAITRHLAAARVSLEKLGLVCDHAGGASGEELKLFVEKERTRIKVEVNHVFRGTLLPVQPRPLAEQAQDLFFSDVEIPVLHPDELYGGKLVAAMDRQHPRDLFDVLMLYENGGLTDGIIDCFVGYLAGHNRPVHEVLFANEIPIESAFHNEFRGMTREPIDLGRLLETRRRLFAEVPARLSRARWEFLLGLVGGVPDWSLMPYEHLSEMPAIRWKLANLDRLLQVNPGKFAFQAEELRRRLGH